MLWVAPTEKDVTNVTLERRLWDTAGQFRANSGLKAQEHSRPAPNAQARKLEDTIAKNAAEILET